MFSNFNNLIDLTLSYRAGPLLGYTEEEIIENFGNQIEALKSELEITDDVIFMNRFGVNTSNGKLSEPIYNPFAINYVFSELQFTDDWSVSGSASLLSKKLIEVGRRYESEFSTTIQHLKISCKPSAMSKTTLMFYGGYATIDKYNIETNMLTLKIPNRSIEMYLDCNYLESMFDNTDTTDFEKLAKKLCKIMTKTPIHKMDSKIKKIQKYLDNILDYYVFKSLSSEVAFRNIIDTVLNIGFNDLSLESLTKNGQFDTLILGKSRIIMIEYKFNKKASAAIDQINRKEYFAKYMNRDLPILLFGISLMTDKKSKNRYIELSYDFKNSNI
jgi:hypothetical protein